tara:strand:+ start:11623 stop:12003 length:381 start_codon:yes stop_codon:yes gene_type:complete
MSQNDFTLANQGFPSMRVDMNDAYQALASNNAGCTAPTTNYPHQWWYDTTNDKLMIRDAGANSWTEFSSGAGATGGGEDLVFYENDKVVTTNYTVVATKNAMSAGPVDVNSGISVTLDAGSRWVIV